MNSKQIVVVILIIVTVSVATIVFYNHINGSKGNIPITLYNVNSDTLFLVEEKRMIKYSEDKNVLMDSIFQEIKKQPKNSNLSSPWPVGLDVVSSEFLDADAYVISFDEKYKELDYSSEILLRSSIAKTILETTECGVKDVYFKIGDEPLIVGLDQEISAFNENNLALCPPINPQKTRNITAILYFIDEGTKKLVPVERDIVTAGDQQDGKYVIEELMKGPDENLGLMKIFSDNVKLKTFSRKSNTCYIEFGSEFRTMFSDNPEIANLQLYAIVNSLASLQEIKLVKFNIYANGQVINVGTVGNLDLDQFFEEDKDLIYYEENEELTY